jgi:hypothetical protein
MFYMFQLYKAIMRERLKRKLLSYALISNNNIYIWRRRKSRRKAGHSLPSASFCFMVLHNLRHWIDGGNMFLRNVGGHLSELMKLYLIAGSVPEEFIEFFNWPNPSSRTMVLGSTQPLTEMSTRNLSGDKKWPVRRADNIIAICEPIV